MEMNTFTVAVKIVLPTQLRFYLVNSYFIVLLHALGIEADSPSRLILRRDRFRRDEDYERIARPKGTPKTLKDHFNCVIVLCQIITLILRGENCSHTWVL